MQAEILDHAQEIQPVELQREKGGNIEGLMDGSCLVVGALVVWMFGSIVSHTESKNELVPTSAPSNAASRSPSFAPSGALDVLVEGVNLTSPWSISTNQWKAINWLQHYQGKIPHCLQRSHSLLPTLRCRGPQVHPGTIG